MPKLNMQQSFQLQAKMRNQSSENLEEVNKKQQANREYNLNRQVLEAFFAQIMSILRSETSSSDKTEQLEELCKQANVPSIQSLLNRSTHPHGQSLLTQAFLDQDFNLASNLLDRGAQIGPVEKSAYDLALDSQSARDSRLPMPSEEGLHPVKDFGLMLGVDMHAEDGTHSQYGHIGPTYQKLTESIGQCSEQLADKDVKEISEAFNYTEKVTDFRFSTQYSADAGQALSERIQQGKTTSIPVSHKGHSTGLTVVPDGSGSKSGYVVFTNRGMGEDSRNHGTVIYKVDDLSKITPDRINKLMNGHSDGMSYRELKMNLAYMTEGKEPVHRIPQESQKVDNCTIANPRSNIHGVMLCQQAIRKQGFDKLDVKDFHDVNSKYAKLSTQMLQNKTEELAKKIKENPKSSLYKTLAKKFVEQNPGAPAKVMEPLERALDETKSTSRMSSPK